MKALMRLFALLTIALLSYPVIGQTDYGINSFYVNLDGDEVDYDTFSGTPLVVEAYATWCSHCHAEHKELVELWDNYNDSINLISLSVASDDDLQAIEDYLIDYPSEWTVGWDRDGNFADQYNIEAFPAIILFDSEGNFGSCDVGERSYEDIAKDVDALLADPLGYVENNGGSGQCEKESFFESIPLVIWIGLFISSSFTVYYIIQAIRNRKKENQQTS